MSGVPRLLVLTDRTQCAGQLVSAVRSAVDAGARAVVLREKDLPAAARDELAEQLAAVLAPVGGLLVRAGASPAPAVHLAAADPFPSVRPGLMGRSCHSAAELDRARAEGCDWVMLSPFAGTPSKPGYGPALGPAGLAALLAGRAGPPVYALGGVRPDDVTACRAAGAYGVAVMGPVMREPRLVAAYLAALR
ncbi:thiamine-phosphate pyrophosphorylase [Modestobacter sp. DSM 44400]|uniref:thiamine phosphate synthase n=1 Tax=Modestobacter sp. DSM 44400 TaxID=1550230 RepID=UPI00089A6B96|nr:thiamine phosphate synthase [Modestobacter sp. DSM 44400]SDY18884.1 thiamine-phosphate pyrophosphorylase [Modestobacter sp. DSM 44400]